MLQEIIVFMKANMKNVLNNLNNSIIFILIFIFYIINVIFFPIKVGWYVNDYHEISTHVNNETLRRITVEDTNKWHEQQHAWLLEEIQKARENGEDVVVITHHAPSRRDTCSKEDEESGLMDAWVNDHDDDCVDPVRLWFYGHTHRSTDLKINSIRVISNQLGYPWEKCGFRPNMKVNLYEDGTVTITD